MLGHLKLRGCWLRDPGHRAWRDFHGAVGDLGWSSLVTESLVAMNFKFAPWLSESFYVQLKDGLESWIAHGSIDNVLFQTLCPKIARDMGEAEHPAFGTIEHMQQISQSISTDLAFVRKGSKVAMRTFYGWPREMLNICLPSWHTMLLVLVHLGLQTMCHCGAQPSTSQLGSPRRLRVLLPLLLQPFMRMRSTRPRGCSALRNTLHFVLGPCKHKEVLQMPHHCQGV